MYPVILTCERVRPAGNNRYLRPLLPVSLYRAGTRSWRMRRWLSRQEKIHLKGLCHDMNFFKGLL